MSTFRLSKWLKKKKAESVKGFKKKSPYRIRLFFKENIEPQEVFLDNLSKKKETELGLSERKFEVPLSRRIIQVFFIFIVFSQLFLFARTFQFQALENEKYLALAQKNKFIVYSIKAARGVIYDSRGEQLVFNEPSFDLILDKDKLPQLDSEKIKVIGEISLILNKDFRELKEEIERDKEPMVLIAENIDHQTLVLFEARKEDFPGFKIERYETRNYKESFSFAHIIGYTGRVSSEEIKEEPEVYSSFDYVGRAGLENSYEEFLRKNPGELRIERDVFGNVISEETASLPESGRSLILWIDSDLQRKIEQVVQNVLPEIKTKKAAVVALDPRSGGVLALVSLPSFDNNLFSRGGSAEDFEQLFSDPDKPLFNRVVSGLYPTGSSIKPLIATAALEEKIISPDKIINCQGKITVPHSYISDIIYEYKDWRIHGLTNIRKAIAESCNVFFYTIGGGYENQKGLGPSRIKKYLEMFGWGNNTGIDIPGEAKGFIPSPDWKKEYKEEPWLDGDTYNLSIGQGDILITPLQVAASFAAIANRGILFQPSIVKEIIDSSVSINEKRIIEEIEPKILNKNFIDQDNIKVIREGMRMAVTGENAPYASSVTLNSLPVSSAAKTGTAQTSKPDYYHNWVTVFAPYENPEIVLTVMIEDVKDVQAVVLPIAREVLNWYFTRSER